MEARKRRPGLAANLALSLASVLVLLGTLELAARLADPKTPLLLLPMAANCLRRSPTLSVELRPHCVGDLAGTPLSTNALGMRGPEVRDDGSIRVLALGDSCTFGWRVSQEESYPALLEKLLNETGAGRRYQVINAGVPGYTSYQGVVALGEKGIPLAPKVVIMAFGFNDANDRGDVERQIAFERRYLPFIRVDDVLLQRSTFYRWARWRSTGIDDGELAGGGAKPAAPAKGRKPDPRVSLDKYIANFEAMVVQAREHGAEPLILSFWPQGGGRAGRRMALGIVADKWDVPIVAYEGPRVDIVHPTADGYRELARRLAVELEVWGLLKDAARRE